MKKRVYIVWNDFYHPQQTLQPLVEKIFPEDRFCIEKAYSYAGFSAYKPDLLVQFAIGSPAPSLEEQQEVARHVTDGGMGLIAFHAGLVLTGEDSPFLQKLGTAHFISHPERKDAALDDPHPEQCEVRVIPLRNVVHPVTAEVEPFCAWDEHYFVKMDVENTMLLACASSVHGTTPCVWAHEAGKGRVVCVTQGHNPGMVEHPQMVRLMENAVNWSVKE